MAYAVSRSLVTHLADIAWLAGLASVAFGIAMIYVPAGIIAAGIGLCFAGFAIGSTGDSA